MNISNSDTLDSALTKCRKSMCLPPFIWFASLGAISALSLELRLWRSLSAPLAWHPMRLWRRSHWSF